MTHTYACKQKHTHTHTCMQAHTTMQTSGGCTQVLIGCPHWFDFLGDFHCCTTRPGSAISLLIKTDSFSLVCLGLIYIMYITCSHRSLPRQPEESFLLENETASDEDAGADGQSQTDVKIILPSVLTHSEAGCVGVICHIYDQTMQMLTKSTALASPDT